MGRAGAGELYAPLFFHPQHLYLALFLLQPDRALAATALTPSTNVADLDPVPDRHRWYFYDNNRTRPGAFGRVDFNDHEMFHAHLSGGIFENVNDEHRYSQYLNKAGNSTITSLTRPAASSAGAPDVDYDKFVQYRQLAYADAGAGSISRRTCIWN